MALLVRQLYFEAVKVGDELPPLVKPPIDRIQIARYAGTSGDFNPLYVDEQFARNAGFPSALAPGMLAMGFLAELTIDWLRGVRLRRFSARFVKIIWPGDVLTSRGRVAERRFEEPGKYSVDIEVWAENQRGELVVRGSIGAQLFYNAEDEARQRAGQPPLLVTQAEEEARLARLGRGISIRRPEPPRHLPPLTPRPAPSRQVPLAPQRTASPAPGHGQPTAAKTAARRPTREKSKVRERTRTRPRSAPRPKHGAKATRAAARARSTSSRKPKGRRRR